MAADPTIVANANLGTVSTEVDVKWDELLAPTPMGIAVMSQLLICSSRVRDFQISNINKEAIPLLKHPESFRTTLVQITNECYEAFMKAHINMERIELKTEKVPDYIRDVVKYTMSGNKSVIQKLLPKRLDRIKEVAAGGQDLSEEVCDTFAKLGQLIRQVIEASTKTMGDHEKADTIGEKTKDVETAKKEEQEKLKREIEKANETVRQKQDYLDGIRQRKWDFWLRRIGCESKDKSLVYAQQMKEEAENKLKEIKAEAEICEKKIDKILQDNIERLEKMGIDVNNEIGPKLVIETLQEGLRYLAELQKNWYGITLFFNKIENDLTETTAKNLEDFIGNADVAQEGSEVYELVMPDSIKVTLQSSYKTHHSAKMYVKVSNNHIMKSINLMHGMLALSPNEVKASQNKLIASCKEASKGIKDMCTEDINNTIREIEVLANPQNS